MLAEPGGGAFSYESVLPPELVATALHYSLLCLAGAAAGIRSMSCAAVLASKTPVCGDYQTLPQVMGQLTESRETYSPQSIRVFIEYQSAGREIESSPPLDAVLARKHEARMFSIYLHSILIHPSSKLLILITALGGRMLCDLLSYNGNDSSQRCYI